MNDNFSSLNSSEQKTLLKVPALMTMLAASYNGGVGDGEVRDAMKLAHTRTFSSEPELQDYYKEVEKVLKEEMDEMRHEFYPLNSKNRERIIHEIGKANQILENTDRDFALTFKHSMKTYEEHVLRSRNNVVEYFLFPFDLRELKL